jgi:hypothetical protein
MACCGLHRQPSERSREETEEDDIDVIGPQHAGRSDSSDDEGRQWLPRLATLFPGDRGDRVQQRLQGLAAKVSGPLAS